MIFILANIADPDEMPHYVAFHLGLHCLSKSELPVKGLFDFIESYVDMMEMVPGGGVGVL